MLNTDMALSALRIFVGRYKNQCERAGEKTDINSGQGRQSDPSVLVFQSDCTEVYFGNYSAFFERFHAEIHILLFKEFVIPASRPS